MSEFNNIVAVDENHFLPPTVRSKIFTSPESDTYLSKIRDNIVSGDAAVKSESDKVSSRLDTLYGEFKEYTSQERGIHKISKPSVMPPEVLIREYYIVEDTTINGYPFYKGMALVLRYKDGSFERWVAGVDNFWTPLGDPFTDTKAPGAGSIVLTEIGDTFVKYKVFGASDNFKLHATPLSISTNGGSTWVDDLPLEGSITGLSLNTNYNLSYKIKDSLGNTSSGDMVAFKTMDEPVWGTAGYDTFNYTDTMIGKPVNGSVSWLASSYPARAPYQSSSVFFVYGGVRAFGPGVFLNIPQNKLDVSFDEQLYAFHSNVGVMFGLKGASSNHPSGNITSWGSGYRVSVKVASPQINLFRYNADGTSTLVSSATVNIPIQNKLMKHRYSLNNGVLKVYLNDQMVFEHNTGYRYLNGDEFGLLFSNHTDMNYIEYMDNFRIRYM